MKSCVLPPTFEILETRIAPAFAAAVPLASLDGSAGFKLSGVSDLDLAGYWVSGAGDVNGDGFGDVLVGAFGADEGGADRGATYVVFGKAGGFGGSMALSSLDGTNGFKLVGLTGDQSATTVSGAGDVNGDGFGDVIVSASSSDDGGTDRGAAYVVFGKAGGFAASVSLQSLNGANGFKLVGLANFDNVGESVSGAGDVNGDGFDDVIVGSLRGDGSVADSGAAYVVFGKSGGFAAKLDLITLDGSNGFEIWGVAASDYTGTSVSAAGDVNGDGFDDVIVGADGANEGGTDRGAAYVVYGKASFVSVVALSTLTSSAGFKLSGIADFSDVGSAVSGAGDVNGDGYDDVIVGAPAAAEGGSSRGASYVVFGKPGTSAASMALSAVDGTNGFKLSGISDTDQAGFAVSEAGDVNGDGFGDLIVGATSADEDGTNRGAAYVVFGKANGFGASVPLSSLNGANGFKLPGVANNDYSCRSVSAAGDVNGDGFADVIVGAHGADEGGPGRGAAYVIFGQPDVKIGFSKDRKTATFPDADGDTVMVKVSKGALSQRDFTFSSGVWQKLNLADDGDEFAGAKVTVTVKKSAGGNGTVNLGKLDATGLDLGAVSIAGDLGQVDAGDGDFKTPAIKSLTVATLGMAGGTQPAGTINPLVSDLVGALGKLTVKGSMKGAVNITGGTGANLGPVSIAGDLDGSAGGTIAGALRAGGNIGAVTVKGSVIGGADFSGILAGGKLGKVKIGAELKSANAAKPVFISALGDLSATTVAKAVAIAGVSVKTNVLNARILAGYTNGLGAVNGDAGIGAISIGGNWGASSVSAGFQDLGGDGFGQTDFAIFIINNLSLPSVIASITIKGTATGSTAMGDHYGIIANRVGKAKIGGTVIALTGGPDNLQLDATNNDFRLVDSA